MKCPKCGFEDCKQLRHYLGVMEQFWCPVCLKTFKPKKTKKKKPVKKKKR